MSQVRYTPVHMLGSKTVARASCPCVDGASSPEPRRLKKRTDKGAQATNGVQAAKGARAARPLAAGAARSGTEEAGQ